ncbi:import inner membrane translocase subunit tim44 [Armillaria luteobubalina]|uniref:Mitochondrial import inner membrane translocase subunit TIM44 n=1 Tax=Armillaria luteobubalina TaxID=153913 RepID=A0AA39QEG9_9AGAR|nr:import inner membrane translocase subunit tim44 [Armillaria luteobubalina]
MLPRHLQSLEFPSRISPILGAPRAGFHSSSRRLNEPPKSPFQTFVDVLKDELRKNRELQDNVKLLQGDVDKFSDSEAMKKARAAYERARLTSSIKENPRLRAAAEELKKTGVKVGDAVGEALKSMEESDIVRAISRATGAVSDTIKKSTEPIRNTAAYQSLSETLIDALDDSGSAKHAGFEEKEARRLRRQRRLIKAGKDSGIGPASKRTAANPERTPYCGHSCRCGTSYEETENPLVSSIRGVTQTVGSWFDENETAQVMRLMKAMDPMFNRESFERELREYIVPEVVDAYLSADQEALKAWCGEATYNVLWATMEQYLRQGLISDSKVLDIRQVDVSAGKILENNIPIFVIQFSTQEVLLFRNVKTKEVVVGAEDRVEQCTYIAAITRLEDELTNELTWRMGRRSARAYL